MLMSTTSLYTSSIGLVYYIFENLNIRTIHFHFEMHVNGFMQLQIAIIDINLTEIQSQRLTFIVFVTLVVLKILFHLLFQVVMCH
jgi:hypothetical protein